MGDPAGIGPEVALRALASPPRSPDIEPLLVGDAAVWHETAARLRLTGVLGRAPLVTTSDLPARFRRPGLPSSPAARAACGAAAHAAIVEAARLVRTGQADALVTAPISKAHLAAAGHDVPGHTELLARLAGAARVRMMMAGPRLRVVLVTIHIPLAAVPGALTVTGIYDSIVLAAAGVRRHYGVRRPRIAVAGLNPHAGEHGLFGDEEERLIAPAVRAARRAGLSAAGPLAADTAFPQAAAGAYDVVVCMYHDQGLGPFKLLHFADGVNVTLGLPFVRTSPDHGTAFDLAGKGVADPSSMAAAMAMAATARRTRAHSALVIPRRPAVR
ncbi:4-hydroxythreonine-4-phosphate dehydrogenase PdxA [Candidatus Binatia bacterium]|nr:4-hydroxythreonine-4-phosphate dehydrogenase PdxA [Candidatus Binatia bacterium]